MVVSNVAGLKLLYWLNLVKYVWVEMLGGVREWYLVNKLFVEAAEDGFGWDIDSGTDLSFNDMRDSNIREIKFIKSSVGQSMNLSLIHI